MTYKHIIYISLVLFSVGDLIRNIRNALMSKNKWKAILGTASLKW